MGNAVYKGGKAIGGHSFCLYHKLAGVTQENLSEQIKNYLNNYYYY